MPSGLVPVEETPEKSGDACVGFPTETLPPPLRRFVEEQADSLPVPPDLIALPVLVTVGAAIGNTRRIRLKDDWTEPASLYAAIIADTGSMKSPALEAALQPIFDGQASGRKRTWTSDSTVEQLGVLLEQHPRGLLLYRDELTGWVFSLNQYKTGAKGADRQFYLSAWSGAPITVDRKLSEVIMVPRPFVSVVGAIQPSLLHHLYARERDEDGFIQRLLFAFPEPVPVRWESKVVSPEAQKAYGQLIEALLGLDWPGQAPVPLKLTPEAQALFQQWHDEHYVEMESPGLPPLLRGFYAKLKGYCARLALIHELATNAEAKEVGAESIAAAAAQVDYFKDQAAKVADRLCRSVGVGKQPKADPVEGCRQEIKRKLQGGRVVKGKRELQKNSLYPAKVFNPAWESLLRPEVIELDGGYTLRQSPSSNRHTDTDIMRGITTSTDIPTTDTTDNGSGGKE